MEYFDQYQQYVAMVEETLDKLLPQGKENCPPDGQMPAKLTEVMRYNALAGGKRVRPVLLLAVCEMLGGSVQEALVPAACLEMIHNYSLIHDDLPGMDNDEYRRGRLTSHKVFGEGLAILGGDALLNYAYECIMNNALAYKDNLEGHVRAAKEMANRAGVSGMIAGQCVDLMSENHEPDADTLYYIHMHKTADLLTAPLMAAAYIAGADEAQREALARFGASVGLAFQIDDDLLDVEGDAKEIGKATGMDAQRGKMTWPSLVGVAGARERSKALWRQAEDSLACFGESAWFLRAFAEALAKRKK